MTRSMRCLSLVLSLLAALLLSPLAVADDVGGEGWTKLRTRPSLLPDALTLQGFAQGIEHAIGGETEVYGHALVVGGEAGQWTLSVDGKRRKLGRLPAVIALGRGRDARAVLLQDRGHQLIWTAHWGVKVKLGKHTWWLVDADADGELWETGDALVSPYSHTATPFVGQAWTEDDAWEIGADGDGQVWSRPARQPRSRAAQPVNDAWRLFVSWRQAAGLRPATWDKELARGARAHADYCERNQVRAITQDEGKPGYSELGDDVGRNSVCSWLYATPREAVLEVLSTAYSLSCALAPALDKCALGHNERSFCFAVNADRSGDDHEGAVQWVWPPHGSRDIVRGFNDNGEVPMPVPGKELEHEQSIGHAVVAKVDPDATAYRFTLTTERGQTVAGHLSTPKASVRHPALRRGDNKELVVFVASTPLPAGTTFVARLEVELDEATIVRTWRFTTGSSLHRVLCPLKKMGRRGRRGGGRRR